MLYLAEFSHMKEVLGRVQVIVEQGCSAYDRPASTWHKSEEMRGKPRNHKSPANLGTRAGEGLGLEPDKNSYCYKA